MPLQYIPVSELEAVNLCLAQIGEDSISDLEVSGVSDVATARDTLHRISREVQSQGWHFNKDTEWPLSPDPASGEVSIPANALSCDPSYVGKRYVDRAGKFWDLANRTFNIGEVVKCDICWFFPFEELPQPARAYIAIRAARVYQRQDLGAESIDALTEDEEVRARANLDRWESEHAETNILNEHSISGTVNRHFNPRRM